MADMTVVQVHLPSDIAAAMRLHDPLGRSDEASLKVRLAVGLFADRSISLAKAASLAGMTRFEFASLLKDLGLAAYQYTDSDYQNDLEFVAEAKGA